MATRIRSGVVAFVLALLLAACDDATEPAQGTSTAGTTTPSTAWSTDPADEAPPVQHPLDTSSLVAAPCSSLTPAQLADLRLGNGYNENPHPRSDDAWLACSFDGQDTTAGLVVFLHYVRHEHGLGELYSLRARPQSEWASFELDGYPAIRYQVYGTANDCDVAIGTNDTEYFRVEVIDSGADAGRDTCGMATTVSAAVLATIKSVN